jgi:hypothetical protein
MQGRTRLKLVDTILRQFAVPKLTPQRIAFAFVVAAVTDAIQFFLGPIGWLGVDEGLDVLAMILTSAALGFHMLLLPTFILKLLPIVEMLPTWTACAAAVVVLRKKAERAAPPGIVAPPRIIDVEAPPKVEPRNDKAENPPSLPPNPA